MRCSASTSSKRKEDTLLDGGRRLSSSPRDGKRVLLSMKDAWSIADAGDKIDPAKARSPSTSVEVQDRSARRVEADLRRGVAHQPRLLLRPEHARRRLEAPCGRSTRSSCPTSPSRAGPQPRDAVDVAASWRSATTASAAATRSPTSKPVPAASSAPTTRSTNGRYRFAKVYGGLNWNPELRSPLTEPGVDVEGRRVPARRRRQGPQVSRRTSTRRFEHTAGTHRRDHASARTPTATGSRTVQVVPIDERGARCATATGSKAICARSTEATNGRVAYVYVPEHRRPGPRLLQALLLPAGGPRRDHRRRALQRRRPASPTTTSTSCAAR